MMQGHEIKNKLAGNVAVAAGPPAMPGIPTATNVYIRARVVSDSARATPEFGSEEEVAAYMACLHLGLSEAAARQVVAGGVTSPSSRCYVCRRSASGLRGASQFGNEDVFWCAVLGG